MPGGRGIKLRHSDLMLLDDMAAAFPELTMIFAHPSVPWADASISIASHKANVCIDLSGWSPKYFPPQLTCAIGSMLKEKALFGSDFPLITPERINDFEKLGIKEEAVPLIMKENALRVLGLWRSDVIPEIRQRWPSDSRQSHSHNDSHPLRTDIAPSRDCITE